LVFGLVERGWGLWLAVWGGGLLGGGVFLVLRFFLGCLVLWVVFVWGCVFGGEGCIFRRWGR